MDLVHSDGCHTVHNKVLEIKAMGILQNVTIWK